MYLAKSRLLEVDWTPSTCLKPPRTSVLRHKYSHVDLERKKNSFGSPTRPRSIPEGVLTRSQMQIAWKVDFWRMVITKSSFLAFRGPPETSLESLQNKFLASYTLLIWAIVSNIKYWSKKVMRLSPGSRGWRPGGGYKRDWESVRISPNMKEIEN